ncbi:MAG TPA: SIR2 family protein [Conexibacter sp.]
MQRDELTDLSGVLARAAALVDGLAAPPNALDVADRPSFLESQPDNAPQPIIERLASTQKLTFVVGAGASMEAGLPSWGRLVRALLESAAPPSLGERDRVAWLDAAAEPGLLGMAATARALAGSDREFVKRVEHHLYRGQGPEHFDPGPLAREIAAWKRDDPEIQLATFNYDSLLEQALHDIGLSAEAREDNESEPDGIAAVRHLHGLLTGRPEDDAVVLTEGDYARWPTGSWQDDFMHDALQGVCVFLGLSFTDQNLLRWIYGSARTEHIAVLARQSTPRLSPAVRRELESATRARLRHANVTAYWADFYAELAQLMHEARRRRGPASHRADTRSERTDVRSEDAADAFLEEAWRLGSARSARSSLSCFPGYAPRWPLSVPTRRTSSSGLGSGGSTTTGAT